ncbi:BZ3500_MvSof-1268-A1-R1_Chr4-2g06950 [Microbotryum saponariae]|uniref:Postreplication repair E3 ubiquitin-protein ligase RAD18 n=1 Tax=Microbotryum saponariae TaxID=289078 RepID=A0A2X0KT07_9BASI|nr:BZ3500_MvSof-1268-A1-R1_Chr4-2g06950 [Microbotryum saponariae]SDA06615.1 BZ3501_MvSof-1269-A2-R1_Chr4-2g06661 [Microbotryum saponariae]
MVRRSTPAPAPPPPVPHALNFDIDDPTDFTSPELGLLDASLRCPICSELFVGPVILTTCCHTFCSRCLRQSLSERRKCPQCAMETDTSRLRKNQRIEEVVQAWQKARAAILDLQALATTASRGSNEGSVPFTSKAQDSRPAKRVKSEGSGHASTSTRSTRNSTTSNRASGTAYDDAASSDLEIIESPPVVSRRSQRSSRGGNPDDPNLNVECPICQAQVRNADMNRHIDSGCAVIKPAGAAWGSMFSSTSANTSGESSKGKAKDEEISGHPTTDPIPQISYAGMKLKRIHSLLEVSLHVSCRIRIGAYSPTQSLVFSPRSQDFNLDLSVPPEATKQDAKVAYLTKRHQRWTTIWNANSDVDPKDPRHKTPSQMRQELKEWETTMSAQENHAIGNRDKYAKEHEKEFRELIRVGKEAQMAAKRKREEVAAEEHGTKDDAMEVEEAGVSAGLDDESASPTLHPPPSSIVPDSPNIPPASMIKPRSSVRFAAAAGSPSPFHSPSSSPAPSVDQAEADPAVDDSSSKKTLPFRVLDLGTHVPIAAASTRDRKRSPSPYDPRGPRPSQRNRQEEEMWARRAEEEEADEEDGEEDDDEAQLRAEGAFWGDYAKESDSLNEGVGDEVSGNVDG